MRGALASEVCGELDRRGDEQASDSGVSVTRISGLSGPLMLQLRSLTWAGGEAGVTSTMFSMLIMS